MAGASASVPSLSSSSFTLIGAYANAGAACKIHPQGGGGGGASAAGTIGGYQNGDPPGHGGDGVEIAITGEALYWAGGGGGGGAGNAMLGGNGGKGGGGGGATYCGDYGNDFATSPVGSGGVGLNNGAAGCTDSTGAFYQHRGGHAGANTGGGGGGAAQGGANKANTGGGNGGSGIVVVRYEITDGGA